MAITATFDSNVFQQVVRPDKFPKDVEQPHLQKIHSALKTGEVLGFIADPLANIEQIPRKQRAAYFGGLRAIVKGSEVVLPDGTIKVSFVVKPDPAAHPGLPPVLVDRIKEGLVLKFKILPCPRIGIPRAPEIKDEWYVADENTTIQAARQKRFFSALHAIESRGVGIAALKTIGARLVAENAATGPWYMGLALTTDQEEIGLIRKAGAEWADGDTIAAHIAYQNQYFCTRDKAVDAGDSVLNEQNRQWLANTYGLKFVTPRELAALI